MYLRKKELIALLDKGLEKVVQDKNSFLDFLSFQARLHKYNFENALLLYSQKPDCTAVATIEQWERVGRRVHRGTKSLGILSDDHKDRHSLFDISMTYGKPFHFNKQYEIQEYQKDTLLKYLNNTVPIPLNKPLNEFVPTFSSLLESYIDFNIINYLSPSQKEEILQITDTYEGYKLIDLCSFGARYTTFKRYGIPTDILNEDISYKHIDEFLQFIKSSKKYVELTGNNIHSISLNTTLLIKNTLKTIEKERENEEKRVELSLRHRGHTGNHSRRTLNELSGPNEGSRVSSGGLAEETETGTDNSSSGLDTERTSDRRGNTPDELLHGESGQQLRQVRERIRRVHEGSEARNSNNDEGIQRMEGSLSGGTDGSRGIQGTTERNLQEAEPKASDNRLPDLGSMGKGFTSLSGGISAGTDSIQIEIDTVNEWVEDETDSFFIEDNLNDVISEEAKNDGGIPSTVSNFVITPNNSISALTGKAKFQANLEAIKTIKFLEKENKNATSEQQEILSKYSGFGSLPELFDNTKESWQTERTALKALVSDEEYSLLEGSTLNAHYTSSEVIEAIYKGLQQMGYSGGNILEPSMGTGYFFGLMPDEIKNNTKLYGVELDTVTAKIAKNLYPEANIQVLPFEKFKVDDNSFTAVVGNVPFGNYKVNDPDYNKHNFNIHDYFIAKAIDKTRPEGIVAVITSKGTLDKENHKARMYFAERAELLGAIRLPNNAFKKSAGTQVTSDILFFRKRAYLADPANERWLNVSTVSSGKVNSDGEPETFPLNNYFIDNPHMFLGYMTTESTQYGHDTRKGFSIFSIMSDNAPPTFQN